MKQTKEEKTELKQSENDPKTNLKQKKPPKAHSVNRMLDSTWPHSAGTQTLSVQYGEYLLIPACYHSQ